MGFNDFQNNDSYKKALKIVMESQKKKHYCCVVPTGPTGPTGAAGIDGVTPVLTIGTVTTGEPGTAASASITGTTPNFILNLTIPQGPTGPAA